MQATGPEDARGHQEGTPRILLLEDNPGDARLFREYLAEGGIEAEVRWETSLADGLEAARGEAPDLLVVDLGLPDSEGLETVRSVIAADGATPTVVLTGRDDPELGRPFLLGGKEVVVDVTIGGVLACDRDVEAAMPLADSEDVVRYADLALYRAKEQSGTSVHAAGRGDVVPGGGYPAAIRAVMAGSLGTWLAPFRGARGPTDPASQEPIR